MHAGMKFAVTAGGQRLGEGFMFRTEVQEEEKHELVCLLLFPMESKCVLKFSSQNIVILSCSVHTVCPPHLMVIISYNDNTK
jgi:hypothetical protein